jgi:hypothetical protein
MSKKVKHDQKYFMPPVTRVKEEEKAAIDAEHIETILNMSYSKRQFKNDEERKKVYSNADDAVRHVMARSSQLFGQKS